MREAARRASGRDKPVKERSAKLLEEIEKRARERVYGPLFADTVAARIKAEVG
jgi:hypothetical protein